eukprot:CAMPEP_0182436518 /NCGR_PEP_ID=MMETSP1167-20130531/82006_1 /TAXON_ID=2988 /ORGANISM="Mallomonas Sp, Strain CCMP3275" /LENGTH=114 /DNA_ID=CAMNT_0024628781 /DNA_START=272 /DNA_END=616 /DNA_ORIENTATION=+
MTNQKANPGKEVCVTDNHQRKTADSSTSFSSLPLKSASPDEINSMIISSDRSTIDTSLSLATIGSMVEIGQHSDRPVTTSGAVLTGPDVESKNNVIKRKRLRPPIASLNNRGIV